MISCCVALPLAFFVELEPCWKCRDLGAALAHEVGPVSYTHLTLPTILLV